MASWFHLIDSARSVPEIVAILRDYFASWTPEEIALLPEPVRPGRVRDVQDIETLHDRLVDEFRGTRATGAHLDALQRLTSHIVRASLRVADLRPPEASDEEPPRSPPKQAKTGREA
jgi:hypothetical protein